MTAQRKGALDRFYALLEELMERQGSPRMLADCKPQMGWPDAGVYFFYEPGEVRENDKPRVVRVGTHRLTATSGATLWSRLNQHRGSPTGGNHRGSIFRLHVGTALLASGDFPSAVATWGTKRAPEGAREREQDLERAVSRLIGQMPFQHLRVDDRAQRGRIEAGAIALLSDYQRPPLDPASANWLGHRSNRVHVRKSHLWNVRHVTEPWATDWLDALAACVQGEPSDPELGGSL